ncbi:MAG: UDP-N-acetylmuramoyl-L-alanyl-D-glutamate--2,6-diaminopimelate ligase [Clostridia bacterium]|nr:UDP-N-acetylmuramoyl-L-alanyl-D-glutamate--2,6-diaminopimelate ligase [Clostridia bacterium]
MRLKDILRDVEHKTVAGNENIEITDIVYDSRKVTKQSVFVCLAGSNFDGHEYINDAIKGGAIAIVAERAIKAPQSATVVMVKDTRKALAFMAAEFFGHPASKLKTIGITGTKGKTTTASMIREILQIEGIKTGLIGTLGVVVDGNTIKTNNTTPESYEVQKYLDLMVKSGCKVAVIEASSIGLKEHRLDGFVFDYGVFTNFSNDHIGQNEHADMEEYIECKSLLFRKCKVGILNKDDKNFERVLNLHTCKVKTYGFGQNADIYAKDEKLLLDKDFVGIKFTLAGDLNFEVKVAIPGKFSAYNALAAISVANEFAASQESILSGLKNIKVKGRIEVLEGPKDYTILIDYAHNALSMENVLSTLRAYHPHRLITLFGAGGNRPKGRRYEMGEVSGNLSDLSIITEDNSRDENVNDILRDIEIGIKKTNGKYVLIPDRYEAIEYSIDIAEPGDIIILAGKGHEDYQEKNGKKYHFDEREVVAEILMKKGYTKNF